MENPWLPPPSFGAPIQEADGRVTLRLRGTPGRRYRIESSYDLAEWLTEAEWTATSSGLVFLVDPVGDAQPRLFRAIEAP
jgi:hypothetical protein